MPKVEIELEATKIKERQADERGRVALGPEFADAQVRVAVVETLGEQSGN
jgi:hypothetical protein